MSSAAERFGKQVTETIALGRSLGLHVSIGVKSGYGEDEDRRVEASTSVSPRTTSIPPSSPMIPPSPEEVVDVPGQAAYTEVMVSRLVNRVGHLPAAVAMLRLTGEQPEMWVLFEEVVASSGVTPDKARGQLRAFSGYTKSVLGTKGWPIQLEWRPDGKIQYRADARVARWIRKALDGH